MKKHFLALLVLINTSLFAVDPITEANYLIITHSALSGSWLTDIENLHTSLGFQVGSYSIEDGATNTGLQNYISNAYNSGVQLIYVLLVGSASMQAAGSSGLGWGKFFEEPRDFDKNIVSAQDFNFIPFLFENMYCWAENRDVPTDDLYDPDFNTLEGLKIGRIPAETVAEVEIYVDKLAVYYNSMVNFQEWKNSEVLISQDADNPWNGIRGSSIDVMYNQVYPYIVSEREPITY